MRIEDIKSQMMQLWKDTFGDTDEYISIIFDSYFNPDLIEYKEENGIIVSAMIGIPYDFIMNGNGCAETVTGLYLCGLATRPEARGKGIITKLMNRIWERASKMGYAFSFLIPASENLRKFYYDRGMSEAFYRYRYEFNVLDDILNNFKIGRALFYKTYKSKCVDTDAYFDLCNRSNIELYASEFCFSLNENSDLLNKLYCFLKESEEENSGLSLIHSYDDFVNIVKENNISRGHVVYCSDENNFISALAVLICRDNKIVAPVFYCLNLKSYISILNYIVENYKKDSLIIYNSSAEKYVAIISSGCDYVLSDVESYAMIRIINPRQILKFTGDPIAVPKYSILAKDEILGGECLLEIDQCEYYNSDSLSDSAKMQRRSVKKLNFQDLANSLFGYPRLQTSNLNLPHISGSVSLMLD